MGNEFQKFPIFVEDNHKLKYIKYSPNFIICGDTDSSYLDISALFERDTDNINDLVEFADALAEGVNNEFPDYIKSVFNVPDDLLNIVKTEREIVSDKSVFFTKKRYAMHIVDKEGQREFPKKDTLVKPDEKVMGLEIVRSDTPKIVQQFLMDLVRIIMENYSFEDVVNFIESFKEEYKTRRFDEIGRPMTIKGLNKYEPIYHQTGAMHSFPYHVRASIFYNELCSTNDIKIKSGDKIRIVYLDNPDSKYIAVPSDAEQYPEFLDNLKVDWKAQWKLVERKIENYLKPIGFDMKSRQEEVQNKLLDF